MYQSQQEMTRVVENASGDFYAELVDEHECNNCMLPQIEAPCLIGLVNGGSRKRQCYFKHQPHSPKEIEQAITTVEMACCERLRYGGTDRAIIARLDGFNCDNA
ncbi:MAG: hypothetical protein JSW10_06055 [Pseudomonadota bacterium]|nr:MAG: hypothetical protein JSW10_06055 [Pseudomonadota bacterium]